MKYIIVTNTSEGIRIGTKEMEELVNSYIEIGYKPLGGISISMDNIKYIFSQAMIKE